MLILNQFILFSINIFLFLSGENNLFNPTLIILKLISHQQLKTTINSNQYLKYKKIQCCVRGSKNEPRKHVVGIHNT